MYTNLERKFKFRKNFRGWGTSTKISIIYEYDKFDVPSHGGFTTNYSVRVDIDTRAGSRRTFADKEFKKLRYAQASIEVRWRVLRTRLEEDQLKHLFAFIYKHWFFKSR